MYNVYKWIQNLVSYNYWLARTAWLPLRDKFNNLSNPMAFRYILMLFSALGISATFMPWLHYPKNDVIFYGYLADGILTGFFFTTCLIYLLVTRKKEHLNKIIISMMGIFGFILAYGAYNKIVNIGQIHNRSLWLNPIYNFTNKSI